MRDLGEAPSLLPASVLPLLKLGDEMGPPLRVVVETQIFLSI
jgi:hypothetical protein